MFFYCESFNQVLCWDNPNDSTIFQGAPGGSFNPDYPKCLPSYTSMAPTATSAPAPPHEFLNFNELRNAINQWKSNEVVAEKTYGHIRDWGVGKVTTFSHLFGSSETFNEDISNWDTSNVTKMAMVFSTYKKFNQDISTWNTAKVTDFSHMFHHCHEFNQDLSAWNVSSAKLFNWMFFYCESFNQVLCWDNPNDSTIFQGAPGGSFNPDYPKCLPSYTSMAPTATSAPAPPHEFLNFNELRNAINQWKSNEVVAEKTYGHIRDWGVGKVTTFSHLFGSSETFNEDISNWDTSNVTKMA